MFSAALALCSKLGIRLFNFRKAMWQRLWLRVVCVSHVDRHTLPWSWRITYSWCSSSMSSWDIPMKSLPSIFSISAGSSVCDMACLSALSNSSGRSWNRSMIFCMPHPGWVGKLAFLFITYVIPILDLLVIRESGSHSFSWSFAAICMRAITITGFLTTESHIDHIIKCR